MAVVLPAPLPVVFAVPLRFVAPVPPVGLAFPVVAVPAALELALALPALEDEAKSAAPEALVALVAEAALVLFNSNSTQSPSVSTDPHGRVR